MKPYLLLLAIFIQAAIALAAPNRSTIQGDLQSLVELHPQNLSIILQTLEDTGFDWNHVKYSSLEKALINENSVDYQFRLGADKETSENGTPLVCKKLFNLILDKNSKKIISSSVQNGKCYDLNLGQE